MASEAESQAKPALQRRIVAFPISLMLIGSAFGPSGLVIPWLAIRRGQLIRPRGAATISGKRWNRAD